jgi:hypothetical protein
MVNRACEKDWSKEARSDAIYTIDHFDDDVVEQLEEGGEVSDDLMNDFPNGDQYHHESHTDKSYTLLEAAHLLDQLSNYEETDSGLWEGVEDPEEALSVKAAFTYGNAVMSEFQDVVRDLNSDFEEEFEPTPRGPKEWRPAKKKGPESIKAWLTEWLKRQKEKL